MRTTKRQQGYRKRTYRSVICLSILLFVSIACEDRLYPEGRSADEYTFNHAEENSSERLSVFFTEPNATTDPDDPEGSPVGSALLSLIERQKSGVMYISCYTFDYQPVIDALLDAMRRGVVIYFVGDADRVDDPGYRALKNAIEENGGSNREELGRGETATPGYSFIYPEYIMHNKFILVTDSEDDRKYVWTGSTNISNSCMLYNNNNALIVQSGKMYDLYLQQFSYLYDRSMEPVSDIEHVSIGNLLLSVMFSYNNSGRRGEALPMSYLKSLIVKSDSAVNFMMFSFTHTSLTAALKKNTLHGKVVRGVLDSSQQYTSAETMSTFDTADVDYRMDGNEIRDPDNRLGGGKLHHKCLIIDPDTHSNAVVVTGSANYTHNAEFNNAENIVIIHSRKYAQLYAEEFSRCWKQGVMF